MFQAFTASPPLVKRKPKPAAKPAPKATKKRAMKPAPKPTRRPSKPKLLSGGNPQIPKGYGDAPVQAYIAAIPGWKRGVARRLDATITAAVPNVRKAVKWNSPLYGLDNPSKEDRWFLGVHCFDKYIKVAFFKGRELRPMPPGESKQKDVRYLNIKERDWGQAFDDAQLTNWITQASELPGEKM